MFVAIQPDFGPVASPETDRSCLRWAELLKQRGHDVKWVDVYSSGIIDDLRGCDGFMWRHGHSADMRQIARRLIPIAEFALGLAVYPDWRTCWHYDDKITQAWLFEAHGIPTPKTWVSFNREDALSVADKVPYPVVGKLWSGAQSSNVRLIRSSAEGRQWVERLFGAGVYGGGEAAGERMSGLRRARHLLRKVLGRSREEGQRAWERHKNYVLFQEFVAHNEFDTRVVVIGNRAYGARRFNRPGDFRASGSNRTDREPAHIDPRAIELGFEVARRLGTQSMALDILRRGDELVVAEISYTYPSDTFREYPGHWVAGAGESGTLSWAQGRIWPEEAQIEDFVRRLEGRASDGATAARRPQTAAGARFPAAEARG